MMRGFWLALLLMASPAWAKPEECGGPKPVELRPIMKTHTRGPMLPTLPEPRGQSLALEILVLPSGVVQQVRILHATAFPDFDAAWRDHVLAQWRWEAMDCKRPIATQLHVIF